MKRIIEIGHKLEIEIKENEDKEIELKKLEIYYKNKLFELKKAE